MSGRSPEAVRMAFRTGPDSDAPASYPAALRAANSVKTRGSARTSKRCASLAAPVPARPPGAPAVNVQRCEAAGFPALSWAVTVTVYRVPELRGARGLNETLRSSADHCAGPKAAWGSAEMVADRVFIGLLKVAEICVSAGTVASAAGTTAVTVGGVESPTGVVPVRLPVVPQPARTTTMLKRASDRRGLYMAVDVPFCATRMFSRLTSCRRREG